MRGQRCRRVGSRWRMAIASRHADTFENMRLRVLYHGNCFDGCSSAGVFTRFYRGARSPRRRSRSSTGRWSTRATPQPFSPDCFDGDENACVDFRYSQDPRLTWWFDHHASAFQLPGDEDHFRADATGRKFYDPAAKSCTKFLADTVAAKFGFDAAPLAELIEWAEIIDGALFPEREDGGRAEGAGAAADDVHREQPPAGARRALHRRPGQPPAGRDRRRPVRRGAAEAAAGAAPAQHRDDPRRRRSWKAASCSSIWPIRRRGAFNKFISYYLFPEARYSVGVTLASRAKISIGANPWSKVPRTHEINKICERYGGGGHPVVGAISIPRAELPRAREIAARDRRRAEHRLARLPRPALARASWERGRAIANASAGPGASRGCGG